jgi:hypothetical protein
MGLKDWFTRKKAEAPPQPQEAISLPSAPARGLIVAFDVSDGLGDIQLEDGTLARFGHSKCRGFDPIAGARVVVHEFGVGLGGKLRALDVSVPGEATGDLDRLHDERARSLGLGHSNEEAIGSALLMGTITLLLRKPLAEGRAALREFLSSAGALSERCTLDFTPSPILTFGGRAFQTFAGSCPFPSAELDARLCDDGFDLGSGFLSLSIGLPDLEVNSRIILGAAAKDPWAEDGAIRELSRFAVRLLPTAHGVILHRAGHVVVPSETWSAWLGDLADPQNMPFGAWIDLGYTADRQHMIVQGMSVFGHENPSIEIADPDSEEERDRAHAALMRACETMLRENRLLRAGDEITAGQCVFAVQESEQGPQLKPADSAL